MKKKWIIIFCIGGLLILIFVALFLCLKLASPNMEVSPNDRNDNYRVWLESSKFTEEERKIYDGELKKIREEGDLITSGPKMTYFELWAEDLINNKTKKIFRFNGGVYSIGLDIYENKVVIGTYVGKFLLIDLISESVEEIPIPLECEYVEHPFNNSIYLYEDYIVYSSLHEVFKFDYKSGKCEIIAKAKGRVPCYKSVSSLEMDDYGNGEWVEYRQWCGPKNYKTHRFHIN